MPGLDVYLMSPPPLDWRLRGRANFRSAAAPDVDPLRARSEWVALADAIEERGGRVVCVTADPETPMSGLPYAAEGGHAVERGGTVTLLLPRMKPEHRRSETRLWAHAARRLGWTAVDPLEQAGVGQASGPAFWEAQGDVARFREVTLLFYGGRTTPSGAEAVAPWFGDPVLVQIREPAFHGNMAALPLPSIDRLVICPEVIEASSLRRLTERFGAALEPVTQQEIAHYATNGLPLGREVLIPDITPARVRALFTAWGLRVVELPMGELCTKAGGASRCLVSHVQLECSTLAVPGDMDYRQVRASLLGPPSVV